MQVPAYLLQEAFNHVFSFFKLLAPCFLNFRRSFQHFLSQIPFSLCLSIFANLKQNNSTTSLKATATLVVACTEDSLTQDDRHLPEKCCADPDPFEKVY